MMSIIFTIGPIRIAKISTDKDEVSLLYRIAPGDSVVFDIIRPGGVGEVYVKDYKGHTLIYSYVSDRPALSDFVVNNSNDTVFWEFIFKGRRGFWASCLGIGGEKYRYNIEISRFTKDPNLINFRTSVIWQTVVETTWVDAVDTTWTVVYDTIIVYDTLWKDTLRLMELYSSKLKVKSGMLGMRNSSECQQYLNIDLPKRLLPTRVGDITAIFGTTNKAEITEIMVIIISSKSSDEIGYTLSSISSQLGKLMLKSDPVSGLSLMSISKMLDISLSSPVDIKAFIYNKRKDRWDYRGQLAMFKVLMTPTNYYYYWSDGKIDLYFDNCYSKLRDKYVGVYISALVKERKAEYIKRKKVISRRVPANFKKYKKPVVKRYRIPT